MKTLIKVLGMVVLFISIASYGCKSTQNTISAPERKKGWEIDNSGNDLELVDLLRRVPGLYVRGSGSNVDVTIRGAKSIQGDNSPLYVLEGVPLGRDYSSVASSININEVESIKVLSGGQAAIYGVRGGNGVILIKKKQ
jgi:TonB-dependent SusC/RagA subfamily outer membrane receptor